MVIVASQKGVEDLRALEYRYSWNRSVNPLTAFGCTLIIC